MDDFLNNLKVALEDKYDIERELGAGGMATVYLARDIKHERQVAVKVSKPPIPKPRNSMPSTSLLTSSNMYLPPMTDLNVLVPSNS